MKKLFIFHLLLLLTANVTFSQSYFDYVVENTRNADMVVEGVVESSEAYQDEHGKIFTKNHLSVWKTLKGDGGGIMALWSSKRPGEKSVM